jgi:uncharacterized repeat protein (TIGR01451 family)
MSKFVARLLSFAILLAGLLIAGGADPARAQVAVSKDLCFPSSSGPTVCVIANGSVLPVVPPSTAVSYQINLSSPTATSVDLAETFAPGFVPQSTTCGPSMPAIASQMFFGPINLLPNQPVTCTITGYFNYLPATANNANNLVTVYPAGNHAGAALVVSNPVNAVVGSPSTIPSDVSVSKTATVTSSGNGTATVHYKITVTNHGPNDVYGLQLQDRVTVPTTSIPLTVTYQGNGACHQWVTSTMSGTPVAGTSDCFGAVPSTIHSPVFVPSTSPVDFVQWSYPALSTGVLKNGNSMVIEFDAVIAVPVGMACQLVVGGNSLINEAHIGFNIPGATTTTFESAFNNNTSSVPVPIAFNAAINPNCGKPALNFTKKLSPGQPATFDWTVNNTVSYDITLQNTSNQPLTNIQLLDTVHSLGDFVSGGIGTPAFEADLFGISCTPAAGCANSTGPGPPQQVTGYLNPHWMAGTNIPSLAAGATVVFQLKINYSNPDCDSYPDIKLKPVNNFARAKYSDPTLGGNAITLQTDPAIALFEPPKPCNFQVTKKVTGGAQKIVFGTPVNYTVTYQNLSGQQATIGTMIDALRIAQPTYASPLNVHYNYTCSATAGVTGFTIVGGTFPIAKSGLVQVVPTALPQQGVRIIQNLVPVIFPAGGTVTCNVTIVVDQPGPGPHCARTGDLDNAAIMDQSAFYDPNLPWPANTNPGFYYHVSLPLPQCFNLVVNKGAVVKGANPPWTTQNGGPIDYQLTISNLGDPIVPSDGVSVTDAFVPVPLWNYVGSSVADQCLNASVFSPNPHLPECNFNWAVPPTNISSMLNILSLAQNWAASPSFRVTGPYPAPYPAKPGQVCNDAAVTLLPPPAGLKPEDWYANDPKTWKTNRCVPIFTVADLKVVKVVQVAAPALPPPPTSFTVTVNCVLMLNNTNYGPSQTFTFNTPPDPIPAQGMSNIPVGSTCTITEQALPATPIPDKGCPSGFAAWGPIKYPNVLDPKQTLQSLVIGASSNTLEVLNSLACVPVQTNIKICKVAGPGIAIGTPFTFSVGASTVTVPAGPAPGGTCVLGPSVPVGSTVTVSETMAGSTVTSIAVAPTSRLVGTPNLAGGSVNVAIGSGMTDVTFTNQKLGFLEICKSGDVAGSFTFTVNPGGLGPFAVPAGACSPAIQVNAGQVVIQEAPTSGISMTGCATVPASQQGACNLGAGTSTVTVASGDVSSATVALITNRKDKETGTLTLKKTIAAPPGGSLPNLGGVVFPVDVVCTPGPSTTVTLTAANPSQVISNIPVGATCSVVEQPLTSTGTCGKPLVSVALPPTYLPGQNVTIPALPASASVEVTNVMACVAQGSLAVIKKMAPGPAAPPAIPPGVTFPVQVSCTPNGPNQVVNLTAATPSVTLSNINLGSTCTITELAPVGPIPSNCKWGPPTYPGGQSATITAQPTAERVVQNALICTGPVLAPVTLLKTITNQVPGLTSTSNIPFPVTITCQPGGAVVNETLLPNTPKTVNLPVGSSCNVAEVTPLPPPPGSCVPGAVVPPVWLPPTYLPGQPVTIPAPPAQLTVTVNNVMACSPTGSLTVTKRIGSQLPGVIVPPLIPFVVNVACTPFGPTPA